jgi:hypothetical protein
VGSSVQEFVKSIGELNEMAKQNSMDLFTTHEELSAGIEDDRASLSQEFRSRLKSLATKVDALQARSLSVMRQSQALLVDTDESRSAFRNAYIQTMAQIQKQFNGQLAAVKRRFAELTELRYSQILDVRDRISNANDALVRARRMQIRALVESVTPGSKRVSPISDEIQVLNQRCSEIEALLKRQLGPAKKQKEKKSPKNGVRVFYHIREDGTAQVILVDEFGIVGP